MLTKAQQDYIDEIVARAGKPSAAVQLQIDRIRAAKTQDELTEIFARDADVVRPKIEAELLVAIMLTKQAEFNPSGKVKERDYREAKWWREAAEKGDAESQYHLGNSYENGFGVQRDEAEAVKWYRKAAEQGNADAQSYLGFMYQFGRGVTTDIDEARKWYQKAADQGDEAAKEQLQLTKNKKRDGQSEQKQPQPLATKARQDHRIQKKRFITLKRCVIGGIWASVICSIGNGMDSSRSWFFTVPITGLPWLIFKISDNETRGERMDTAEAIGLLIVGALLSLFSALPVLIAFAFLKNVFASH